MSENFRGSRRDATLGLAQMQAERSRDAPCPTVGVAHDTWWVAWADESAGAGRLAGGSRRIFDNAYRAWIGPRWGNEPMGSVKFGECAGTNVLVAPVRRQVGERGEVSERLKTRFSRRWIVLCGRPAERAHEIVLARLDGGVEWLSGFGNAPGAGTVRYRWGTTPRGAGTRVLPMQALRPFWSLMELMRDGVFLMFFAKFSRAH